MSELTDTSFEFERVDRLSSVCYGAGLCALLLLILPGLGNAYVPDLSHDQNGNLTADGSRSYHYDFANRLVRIADPNGAPIASYAYDALGRRIQKQAGANTTTFFYDGSRSIEERDATDAVLRQYVFGRGIDEALELRTPTTSFYYQENSLGSIAALSDANGQVIERYRYSAYGETTVLAADGTTVLPASTVSNPFRFTGRRFDSESQLYYYRARYYAPERGRFLQRDPQGYVDGLNLYEYVTSNPINWVDPLGFGKGAPGWGDWLLTQSHKLATGQIADRLDSLARGMGSWAEDFAANHPGTAGSALAALVKTDAQILGFLSGTVGDTARFGEGLGDGTLGGVVEDIVRGSVIGAPAVRMALGGTGQVVRTGHQSIRGAATGSNVGLNPFKGKTPQQVDEMMRKKGFEARGPDPVSGQGGYVNPKTGRSYHIDPEPRVYKSGTELPHVDVNRPRGYGGPLEKRKFPLGGSVNE